MKEYKGHDYIYPVASRLQNGPANVTGHTPTVRMHKFWVGTHEDHRERFLKRIARALSNKANENSIDELCTAINESLMNVNEHVHKFDRSKKALVHLYEIDNVLSYTIQHEEVPIDTSKIRTECVNPDGTLYKGWKGRGHILLKEYSDNFAYPLKKKRGQEYVSEAHGAKSLSKAS